jgi:hypothetical protein
MEIHIKPTTGGEGYSISGVTEASTVKDLKQAILEKTKVRPFSYNLVLNGVTLKDENVLGEAGVKNGVTLSEVPTGLLD